jgi:hypothetical protein
MSGHCKKCGWDDCACEKIAASRSAQQSKLAESNVLVTEIVFTWPDGREEVRYRRPTNSPEALELINEVLDLQAKHGLSCPYSFRNA